MKLINLRTTQCRVASLLWLVFALVLSPTAALCQKPNDDAPAFNTVMYSAASWKEYKPLGGRYSALLPGLPREQIQTVDTAIGKTSIHMSMLAIIYKDEFVICATNYNDFPAQITDPTIIRKVLDGARDELLSEKTTRRLISETEVQLDSNLGREIKIEEGDMIMFARLFLVRDRLFQVLAVVGKGPKPNDVVGFQDEVREKFFASFKVFP